MLPSTFLLRLWCLPYQDPRSIQDNDEDCQHLITRLGSTVSLFLGSSEGDILLRATLAEDIYTTLVSVYTATTTRLRIAVHVGNLNIGHGQARSAAQLVKVSVTLKLVDSVSKSRALRKPKSELTSEMLMNNNHLAPPRVISMAKAQSEYQYVANNGLTCSHNVYRDVLMDNAKRCYGNILVGHSILFGWIPPIIELAP
ncbi:hypothetical protein F5Y09DRAFT_344920 [Xylaria sp. FL1042]|nr:hypothetical protein F5Y09DRAFT_344920 [Xylaria sp. FL1042]